MSEVKKIATRDSYGNALVELGKAHDDLIYQLICHVCIRQKL